MTLLFHLTGGAANPFVSLLLFPLTISASILPKRFTWFMVFFTLSAYGSLFLVDMNQLFPGVMESSAEQGQSHNMHQHHQHAGDETFSLHIIGMWFNFALSAILISFFIVRMNLEIKQQADKINQQREQMLRDEQVLGIATQAASAAHHMSTPLASMAVLIEDLKHDYQEGELAEDLNLLAAQIASCTQVLDNLRDQARLRSRSESIADFTQRLIDECRLLRPNTRIETEHRYSQIQGKYTISSDPALRMAILNILKQCCRCVSPACVFCSLCGREFAKY